MSNIKFKMPNFFYWLVPVLAFLPQLFMTLNSFNQMRFEEFYEAVVGPFWFAHGQIISGLHVNVGWYGFLTAVYSIFGFSLHTGKISYLVMAFFSNFVLFYLLTRFFKKWVASLILLTIALSPTVLFINALNLHWALTFHILIIIFGLLYLLDFSKKKLSLVISAALFFLMMWGWFSYQAFVFYIPSLVIFYWLKLKQYNRHKFYKNYILTAALAFLLPLVMLFVYVESEQAPFASAGSEQAPFASVGSKQMLIFDSGTGSGLFRGGGRFEFTDQVFANAWTDFFIDFFDRGISHHYEVGQAEFSLIFPVITLTFIFYALVKIWSKFKESRFLILLALLVMAFDMFVFSTTSDLGLPGMKRMTPFLFSIYFLWILVWYYVKNFKWVGIVMLSLLLVHHIVVYPINLAHLKDPSPFKVADWFDGQNPQKSIEEAVAVAQKQELILDCRTHLAELGQCDYTFIYASIASRCKFNHLDCKGVRVYDQDSGDFKELNIREFGSFFN